MVIRYAPKIPSKASEKSAPLGKPPRRRGAVKGELVGVRFQPELLALIDAERGERSRPEAIRRLVEKTLNVGSDS